VPPVIIIWTLKYIIPSAGTKHKIPFLTGSIDANKRDWSGNIATKSFLSKYPIGKSHPNSLNEPIDLLSRVILAGAGRPWAVKFIKEWSPSGMGAPPFGSGLCISMSWAIVPAICQSTFLFHHLPPAFTDEMGAEKTISTAMDNDRINNLFHITILLSR
jgi:hypothetical protein